MKRLPLKSLLLSLPLLALTATGSASMPLDKPSLHDCAPQTQTNSQATTDTRCKDNINDEVFGVIEAEKQAKMDAFLIKKLSKTRDSSSIESSTIMDMPD